MVQSLKGVIFDYAYVLIFINTAILIWQIRSGTPYFTKMDCVYYISSVGFGYSIKVMELSKKAKET